MKYQLREYQQKASDAAVHFLTTNTSQRGGLLILPTGAGKSLVIADIASKIDEPLIVLQPSKEILEQNYNKLISYDVFDCSIYSASLNRKEINRITFATIGSVMNHLHDFDRFKYIIIDECHLVNPSKGQYKDFIEAVEGRKVIGLTATPYRLGQTIDPKTIKWKVPQYGSILKFITRTRPRIFERVLYFAQVRDLLDKGYLAKLRYFDMIAIEGKRRLNMDNVKLNTTGADYDEKSLKAEMERADFYEYTLQIINRLLHPKDGKPRNGILVFTKFVEDAERLTWDLDGICEMVSGETPKKEREAIIDRFKSGQTKVVANVGVFTTGFDYPELDTIILARPTMSLALYYQMVGRAIRPYPGKDGWVIDLCGSYAKFGDVADLTIDQEGCNKWIITGTKEKKQLTNIIMRK
jgi:DNA repair protein RadD